MPDIFGHEENEELHLTTLEKRYLEGLLNHELKKEKSSTSGHNFIQMLIWKLDRMDTEE